jgi:uncharacterized damage-inducible protein DinB
MTPDEIKLIFDYNAWAFDRVWSCVEQLTDEQFVEEVDYSRGSVRNQTLHIITAIERWMQRLEGNPPSASPPAEDFRTRASVRERWEQTRAALNAYLSDLDQIRLDEIVEGRLAGRGLDYANTRSDLLQHLSNHGTDHRAQVLAILHSEFHIPTVEQDLALYLIEIAGSVGQGD